MFTPSGPFRRLARACAGLALAAPALAADPAGIEFFEKQIRPLLASRCLECHAAEHKVKAGLRLDHPAGWLLGGDSGPAVLPGRPDESPLIKAIRYTKLEFEAMPPRSALPREEVALLEEWVRRGAPAPDEPAPVPGAAPARRALTVEEGRRFWSFIPPAPAAVPAPDAAGWARTDLDRFIAARWPEQGLTPAPDAAPAALLRRASFDLLGLPPTPEQIAAFTRDPSPAAFARQVDAMLAAPQFGERWGRRWLDVARFAESSGGGRTLLFKDAWRYRDYVIDAVNRDLPFDAFIREQLAGDLLPAADPAERARRLTATAFLTLGPTNYEEQNKDQLRMDIIDEQLDTLGKAFLGMTLSCARCHDHKFDPVTLRDYYGLAGILRGTHTLHNYTDNVARWVDAPLPLPPEQERAVAEHEARVAALEKKATRLRAAARAPAAKNPRSLAPAELPGLVLDEGQARVVGAWKASRTTPGYVGEGYLTDDNEGKGAKTVSFTPALPQSGRYEVRLAYTAAANRASNVPVTILHADGEATVTVNQRVTPPGGERLLSLGQFRFEQDGQGYVLISNEGTDGHVIVDALQLLPLDARGEAAAAVARADPASAARAAELRAVEAELKQLAASGPHRPLTMSVREAAGEIGDTEIRVRGIARNLGPKVPRGFLAVAHRGDAPRFRPDESGRRELADWIADPGHPLTARVTVNRIWAWLLGEGLVRTVDNFGTTGEPPTHPELLDHLALRFTAGGWSVKALVREIMLSRVYQLSSVPPAGVGERDPANRLLSHAHRRRLEAEEIRDALLWAAGRLDPAVGGPNLGAKPPASEYGFVFADLRRSVYTPAFRNRRPELFEAFDFADINAPLARRHATTVAPQALFLLNHPFVIEQARHAAGRLARELPAAGDDTRFAHACQLILGRPPRPGEVALAREFLGGAPAG
ncbi:MAG: DUF1553 domain-containing protein [Opitutaceae bacterium]